jgi:hypothetical protein
MRFIESGQYNSIGSEEQRGYVNRANITEGFIDSTEAYNIVTRTNSDTNIFTYINDLSLTNLYNIVNDASSYSSLTATPITSTILNNRNNFNKILSEIINRLDASYNIINSSYFSSTDLKNNIKELKDDIASAKLRKEAIEKQEEKTSYNQLFGGFARPLRIISVPVLISITIMLLFMSVFCVFYVFKGSNNSSSNSNIGFSGVTGSKNSNNMFKRFGLKTL